MVRSSMVLLVGIVTAQAVAAAEQTDREFRLRLRTARVEAGMDGPEGAVPRLARSERPEMWPAAETAIIICDVWDRHHCHNAVRRMEEFVPRLDAVVNEARRRGAVVIHAPSDCMPAYESHPARARAIEVPGAPGAPPGIRSWCSQIPAEERAAYPIDQSDGGEDDDPVEHAEWAARLKAEGRDPGLPWKSQHSGITIDSARDYVSDRGDEVWNILERHRIRNVILAGVHTNMCVLGRPFGLRQMVRGGKNVVLMRDLTDCMYNPQRWPWVDHFTGNDLVIAHVERHVCPTITSDQILGGQPHRSRFDDRRERDIASVPSAPATSEELGRRWVAALVPGTWKSASEGRRTTVSGPAWFRCTIRLPSAWIERGPVHLQLPEGLDIQAWLNGTPVTGIDGSRTVHLPPSALMADGVNLLVLRTVQKNSAETLPGPASIASGSRGLELKGRWHVRLGDDETWSSLPLPAQFGIGPDVLFDPE